MKQPPISEESFQTLLNDDDDLSSISGSGSDDGSESGNEGIDRRSRMPGVTEGMSGDDEEISGTGQIQRSQQVPQFVFQTSGELSLTPEHFIPYIYQQYKGTSIYTINTI